MKNNILLVIVLCPYCNSEYEFWKWMEYTRCNICGTKFKVREYIESKSESELGKFIEKLNRIYDDEKERCQD